MNDATVPAALNDCSITGMLQLTRIYPPPTQPHCDRFALLADLTAAGWTTMRSSLIQWVRELFKSFSICSVLKNYFKSCCPLDSNGAPPPSVAPVALSTSLYFGLI